MRHEENRPRGRPELIDPAPFWGQDAVPVLVRLVVLFGVSYALIALLQAVRGWLAV